MKRRLGPMPLNEHRTIHRPLSPLSQSTAQDEDVAAATQSAAQAPAVSTLQSLAPVNSFAGDWRQRHGDSAGYGGSGGTPPSDGGAQQPGRDPRRSGKILSAITNWTFWAALGVTQSFDAHILYDPYAERWIFSSAAGENSSTAAVLIGCLAN